MKIIVELHSHKLIFTEEAISKKNVMGSSESMILDSIEFINDKKLLREFAYQILDNEEYWDEGCPLCGSRT